MTEILQFLFFIVCTIGLICICHVFINNIRGVFVPKITKNLYHTQVEKYQELVKEIQQAYNNDQEKIEMENELVEFVENSVNEYKH